MRRILTEQEKKDIEFKIHFKQTHEHKCYYCGKMITNKWDLTVDHIKPISHGGKTIERNLLIACRSCNHEKSNKNFRRYNSIKKQARIMVRIESLNDKHKIGKLVSSHNPDAMEIARRDSRVIQLKSVNQSKTVRWLSKMEEVYGIVQEYNEVKKDIIDKKCKGKTNKQKKREHMASMKAKAIGCN